MRTFATLGFRGAVIASLTVAAACGGVSSSPSATTDLSSSGPSPISSQGDGALTETFTSTFHGYSVQYPAGWSATQAAGPWRAGASAANWGSPVLDDLHGSAVRLSAASQPLATAQTADAWLTTYASYGACEGADPSSWPTIQVGDQVGKMSADGCAAKGASIASGGLLFDVVVFVGGRAYDFTIDGLTDHAFVEAILATVVFDPNSAAS